MPRTTSRKWTRGPVHPAYPTQVYLTVDLDFWDWDSCFAEPDRPERHALAFMRRLVSLGVPVTIYVEHGEVLEDLKRQCFTHVVNVDFHDDLVLPCDVANSPLDASWANHVPGRGRMVYEWRYPDFKTCCLERRGLCSNPDEILWPSMDHEWRYIRRDEGVRGLPWRDVSAVSVVLSPAYTCPRYVMPAVELLLKHYRPSRSVLRVVEEWRRLFPW